MTTSCHTLGRNHAIGSVGSRIATESTIETLRQNIPAGCSDYSCLTSCSHKPNTGIPAPFGKDRFRTEQRPRRDSKSAGVFVSSRPACRSACVCVCVFGCVCLCVCVFVSLRRPFPQSCVCLSSYVGPPPFGKWWIQFNHGAGQCKAILTLSLPIDNVIY